jgi:opacity protein-like surface antigen
MSNHRWQATLIVLIIAGAPLLCAQTSEQQYEGGGFVGGSFFAGDHQFSTLVSGSLTETSRTVGVHYGSGYQFGARVAENVNPYWSADLEYTFANQPMRFTNLTPTVQSLSLSQSVHHFTYNVSYLPPVRAGRWEPYVKAGAGAAWFYIHANSRDDALAQGVSLHNSWKFAFNWGGGVKYVANEQAVLIFDIKDYMIGIPNYGLPGSAQVVNGQFQPGFTPKGVLNNVQLNLGVSFRWNDW